MDTLPDFKIYQLPGVFARNEAKKQYARASLNCEISAKLELRISANVRRSQLLLNRKPKAWLDLAFLNY